MGDVPENAQPERRKVVLQAQSLRELGGPLTISIAISGLWAFRHVLAFLHAANQINQESCDMYIYIYIGIESKSFIKHSNC